MNFRQGTPLTLRRMGIDTYQEPVVYMHRDCPVCRAEGFDAKSRVAIRTAGGKSIVATLNVVESDLLGEDEAALSEAAWRRLDPAPGETAHFTHPEPAESDSVLRAKVFGHALGDEDFHRLMKDVVAGRFSDIELAAFVTACVGDRLSNQETIAMTRAMVDVGERIDWGRPVVLDKHCVGGLPGNRTTPIVVAIVAAAGHWIPKTSSRAITSPAGTADTMETMTNVTHDLAQMRRVVEREGGCVVWGGAVSLSPADDILIRVERPLDFDSDAQLTASVLSKKIAAGATHVLIDVPMGPTAKVRSAEAAARLSALLQQVAKALGLQVKIHVSDGQQPVGNGIGPALEARDVLHVLRNAPEAPLDLRSRALDLAGVLLDWAPGEPGSGGRARAEALLDSGAALKKFLAICEAQGGFTEPGQARHRTLLCANQAGRVVSMDSRRLSKLAKLAGAPRAPLAGVDLHVQVGQRVAVDQPLLTLHAESLGELAYADDFLRKQIDILRVEPDA